MRKGVFPLPPTVRLPMLITGIGGFFAFAKILFDMTITQYKKERGKRAKAKRYSKKEEG